MGQNHIQKLTELWEKKKERTEKNIDFTNACTLTSELWLHKYVNCKNRITDKVRKFDYQVEATEKPCRVRSEVWSEEFVTFGNG